MKPTDKPDAKLLTNWDAIELKNEAPIRSSELTGLINHHHKMTSQWDNVFDMGKNILVKNNKFLDKYIMAKDSEGFNEKEFIAENLGDAVYNAKTSLGSGLDRSVHTQLVAAQEVTLHAATYAYQSTWLAKKIIDQIPSDMIKSGYSISYDGQTNESDAYIRMRLKDLDYEHKLFNNLRWSRLYGGSAVVLFLRDSMLSAETLETEIDYHNLDEGHFIESIQTMDRWMLYIHPGEMYPKDMFSVFAAEFARPNYYSATLPTFAVLTEGDQGIPIQYSRIHVSRLLMNRGDELPYWGYSLNGFWDDSVLRALYEKIIGWETAYQEVHSLIQEAKVDVIKIPGLVQHLVAGGQSRGAMLKMMQDVLSQKSAQRAYFLDAGADFQHKNINFTGINATLQMLTEEISPMTGLVPMILTGKSWGGMNANTDGDMAVYNNTISRKQEFELEKHHRRMTLLLLNEYRYKINRNFKMPMDVDVTFHPVIRTTEAQKKINLLTLSQGLGQMFDRGAITSRQMAKAIQESGYVPSLKPEDVEVIPDVIALPIEGADDGSSPDGVDNQAKSTKQSSKPDNT